VDPDNFQFSFPRMYFNEERLRQQHQAHFDSDRVIAAARERVAGNKTGRDGRSTFADLPRVAQGAFLARDEAMARALVDQARAWWLANPPFHGAGWKGAATPAIRLIHWIWSLAMVRDLLSGDSQHESQEWVYRHAQWLSAWLPRLRADVDRVMAASALAVAGTHFSLFDRAEAWEKQSWQVLIERVHRAVGPRRLPEEVICILQFVLVAYSVAKMKRLALPVAMLVEMERAVLDLTREKSTPQPPLPHPAFGGDEPPLRRLANSLAIIRANAELKAFAQPLDEWTFWVFGDQAVEGYERVTV